MNPLKNRSLILMTLLAALLSAVGNAEVNSEPLGDYQPALSPAFKTLVEQADIDAGAKYFDRKCATCHDVAKDGIHNLGPKLWNVFGREAGSVTSFQYSEAMRQSGHTWDFATLNYYLTNTERAIPGRAMNFRGIKSDQKRAELLAYLRQFNDTVPAFPE